MDYSRQDFPACTSFGPRTSTPLIRVRNRIFTYRALRAIYPAFRLLFPNQVIPADDQAAAMVDVAVRGTGERESLIFENRDIRAIAASLHKKK